MVSEITCIKNEFFNTRNEVVRTVKDCMKDHTIQKLRETFTDFDTVFRMSLIGPLAMLAIFKQFDFLIYHESINYLSNIEVLVEKEETELVLKEITFLRDIKHQIQIKYPHSVPYGIFNLNLQKSKEEFIKQAQDLISSIE